MLIIDTPPTKTSHKVVSEKVVSEVEHSERALRRIAGWLMLFCLLLGQIGAPWDGEWHAYIGRDWFWTPPHDLIYTCVAGGGLIALVMVILETLRYRKGYRGVDDQSTVRLGRVFHAPLGFYIAGFGALAALFAAPFDNYWHQLYGIDISLWSPFHIMGVTGCFIGALGIVYIFASEAAIDRRAAISKRRFLGFTALEWGALFALSSLLKLTLIGFLLFPVITLGLLRIPTYLIPAVICAGLCLMGAAFLTRRPGAATFVIVLVSIASFATELFVPWATRALVAQEGLHYRVAGQVPYFALNTALLPLFLLPSALFIDILIYWQKRRGKTMREGIRSLWLPGLITTLLEIIIAPCIIMQTANPLQAFLNMPDLSIAPNLKLYTTLIALPVIFFAGLLGTCWGANQGSIWHLNKQ